jgi:hypothetical protein
VSYVVPRGLIKIAPAGRERHDLLGMLVKTVRPRTVSGTLAESLPAESGMPVRSTLGFIHLPHFVTDRRFNCTTPPTKRGGPMSASPPISRSASITACVSALSFTHSFRETCISKAPSPARQGSRGITRGREPSSTPLSG